MASWRALAGTAGVASALGGAAAWFSLGPAQPPRPNVLVVLWDTVRADRTSLYGGPATTTPRMAAWAEANGVVFEQAVSADMWTVPSHASMFTGLPAKTHGADIDHRWLDDDHVTLAERLAAEGYETYAFSANPNLSGTHVNLLQGFAWVDTSFGDGRFARMASANTRGKLLLQDASTEISPGNPNRELGGLSFNAGPVAHTAFTEWLDSAHVDGRPWLAYLSYMEAHKPRVPSASARRRVAPDAVTRRAFTTDLTFGRQLRYTYGLEDLDADELTAVRATYDASLVDLDDATADLFADLDARGILDDTVVVFTSDHGEQLGEHHRFGHRMGLDRALVHVPLVVAWRGHLAPARIAEPVSTSGLFRTVASLLRLPDAIPGDDWLQPDRPDLVFSESFGWDQGAWARVHTLAPTLDRGPFARTWGAVQRGRWWLVESRPADGGAPDVHLYDALTDPAEDRDLAGAEPALAAELRALLVARDAATPTAHPHDAPEALDDETRRQLELLGYVSDDGE